MCVCMYMGVYTHLPSGEKSRAFPDFTEADLDCIFVHPELLIEKSQIRRFVGDHRWGPSKKQRDLEAGRVLVSVTEFVDLDVVEAASAT